MFGKILFGVAMAGAGTLMGYLSAQKTKKGVFDIREGDLIQWESKGAFIFPQPRKVSRVVKSEAGTYVFVERCGTGIPIEQVVLLDDGQEEEDCEEED
jgi:hypothetical protein